MRTLVSLTLLAAIAHAQESTPLVRSNTRVVLLDVVVTDGAGKPLRTLTRDNFRVYENGVAQKISSFEAPIATASSGVALPNSPRNIILLDQLNITFADLSYGRDQLLLFLERNHLESNPTALMALGIRGLTTIQEYTQDRDLLKEKLTLFHPVMSNPIEGVIDQGKGEEHAQQSIAALFNIAEASQGSPYNLNVIWVTSGFAGSLKESKAKDGTDTGIRRLSNLLLHARLRLYTIDPQGVKPLAATAVATPIAKTRTGRDGVQSASDSAAEEALASQGAAYEPNQFLSLLTGMMGGRSYFGRNDIDIAFSQAIADGAGNYSLSYTPANADFHGEYRRIEIRTNVEFTKARTRLGYYAIADEPALTPEMREAKWKAALSSPLAYEGFALSCPLTYDASGNHAVGVLTVKPTELGMQMEQQSREVIRVAAVSKSGSILSEWNWQIDWKKPWTNRVTTANFDKPLPAKTNLLRFLISDPAAQQIGTCDYRLPLMKGS